jgi:hypothetical protein
MLAGWVGTEKRFIVFSVFIRVLDAHALMIGTCFNLSIFKSYIDIKPLGRRYL